MREERLLERIRSREREPNRRARRDPKRIVDSVLGHLTRILNTKRGSAQIAEDFGLPDFTEFLRAYPDSIRDMERMVRRTILKYEPRLAGVRVRFIPREEDALSLRFQITARLSIDEKKSPVIFESVVGSDGKISVRS